MWPLPPQPPRKGGCRAADPMCPPSTWMQPIQSVASNATQKSEPRGHSQAAAGRRTARRRATGAARPCPPSSNLTTCWPPPAWGSWPLGGEGPPLPSPMPACNCQPSVQHQQVTAVRWPRPAAVATKSGSN
eukprot:5011909-Alexandrium_andersonii.AAC.1